MGLKRLIKKVSLGGGIIRGHIYDAIQKKKETGKSFRECLSESVKETVAEDMPGTRHVYKMGKTDGRKQGTVEQARRDEKKMQKMQEDHERDRQEWEKIDKEKDELLDETEKNL
ncbi:MAG: hypothetical protein IKR52_09015 [Paludibacteraceae bacterium]|nr:hypothetical protein [Paludibacteraceae bacterium]